MSTTNHLLEKAAAGAKAAREIAEKADREGRDMTRAERAEFDEKFRVATEAKKDHDVLKHADEMAKAVGGAGNYNNANHNNGGSKGWASEVANRLEKAMPATDGQKAIVSGTIGTPNVIEPGIVTMGQVPTSLLDLIPSMTAASDGRGGNTFTFLRQTTRTNNAAVVADNATKPTSVYTVTEIEDRFRVVAHLSEAIPLRYFADHSQLETWLESEMQYGLRRAVEAEILAGDGTDEHFTGILETSGIVSQAFSTDVFQTTRKAKTALESSGQQPTAFVFNPTDDETFDLAQDGNERYYGNGPFTSGPRTLWDLPRVTSTAVTAGTAVLADWRQAELLVREGATLAVDTGGELFEKNQAKMRLEGRFGFAVKRPAAFATIALAAE